MNIADIYNKTLIQIIAEARQDASEPLDGDEGEKLGRIITSYIQFQEGNITEDEFHQQLNMTESLQPSDREIAVIWLTDGDLEMALDMNPEEMSDEDFNELGQLLADVIEDKISYAECLVEAKERLYSSTDIMVDL